VAGGCGLCFFKVLRFQVFLRVCPQKNTQIDSKVHPKKLNSTALPLNKFCGNLPPKVKGDRQLHQKN